MSTQRTIATLMLASLTGILWDHPVAHATAKQGTPSRTRIALEMARLTGVLDSAPLTIVQTRGANITAVSVPVVRSNTGWRLRVSLVPPFDPRLQATVAGVNVSAVTLDAKSPSGIVAGGRTACGACPVTLKWSLLLPGANHGKKGAPSVLPRVAYRVEPDA